MKLLGTTEAWEYRRIRIISWIILASFILHSCSLLFQWFPELYCIYSRILKVFPAHNDLLKVTNRNTKKRYEICSKFTLKTTKRVSSVLTLNVFHTFSIVSIVDFAKVLVCQVEIDWRIGTTLIKYHHQVLGVFRL